MTINRQVNKNITKEYYFNNNGEGFNSPHVITIGGLNIKVEVYSHNLTEKELTKVETYIKITANDFNKFFKLGESSSEQTFKIYIFGNRDDYTNLGGKEHFDFGLGEEGGMCFHRGEPDVFAEMYVYQKGNGVLNLQHEFAHGLTYYATKGMPLPNVLMEGVAEFFEYHGDDNDISHMKQDIDHILYLEGQNRKSLQNKGLNLDNFDLYKVLSLSYSAGDVHKNHLVYTMGHTLMKYLIKDHPNIIREYVHKVSTGSLTDEKKWLQQELKGHNQPFKEWLQKAKSMDLESFKKLFNSDDGYQNDQAADISRPSISKEDEYNTLSKEYDKLLKEHTSKLKKYNEERSEGDFRAIDDMQEIDTISIELMAVRDRMDALRPPKVEKIEEVFNRSQYASELSPSELSTKVLDDHHIYKVIYGKMVSGDYTIKQFDKLYGKVSEKIITQPMTIAEVREFCLNNNIPPLTDNELRSLVPQEKKGYTDTKTSVKDSDEYGYIGSGAKMSVSYGSERPTKQNVNDVTEIIDADSFYKFIYVKVLDRAYDSKQYYTLYEEVSEKLVHTPMSKDEINQVYDDHGIKRITEAEWEKLITRQETRRTPEKISEITDDLEFQGNINIKINDDTKLKIDLYHNKSSLDQAVLQNMQNSLLEVTQAFYERFGIKQSGEINFRLFLFDNQGDYRDYIGKSGTVGVATASDNGNISSMYSFFSRDDATGDAIGDNFYHTLKHEFAHALTFNATAKKGLPLVLMEGIAEYIAEKASGRDENHLKESVEATDLDFTIEYIIENQINPYTTGAAVVAYLEHKYPHFLDNLLYAANEGRKTATGHHYYKQMLEDLYSQEQGNTIRSIEWFDAKDRLKLVDGESHSPIDGNFGVAVQDDALRIQRSSDWDSEGKHKAVVTINGSYMQSLYSATEGDEQYSILLFLHALSDLGYKIAELPKDKYYFQKGKFFICNEQDKELIALPGNQVFIKIMKLGEKYSLVITNRNGDIISNISKMDNLNYELLSQSDHFSFLKSAFSQVEKEVVEPELQSDEGHHISPQPEEQRVQQRPDRAEEKAAPEDNQSDWNYNDFGTPGVAVQAASDIASSVWTGVSNWWSGSNSQEERSEPQVESKVQPSSGSSSLRGLAGLSREDEMQSDQPMPSQSLARSRKSAPSEEKQEQIILKDTILKVQKSYDQDSEGKHKVNVAIDYYSVKALYDKAEGEDKGSVLKFWHKLHTSEYKVGDLPEDKYYFKDGKFVIHDNDAKKLIVLPEDKISIKIMKLGNDYDLVITNENGRVISNVSRVDNLNYDLLSDTSGFSLETLDTIQLSDPHSEYDSYLISGLGGKMFDCPSYHTHDHNII